MAFVWIKSLKKTLIDDKLSLARRDNDPDENNDGINSSDNALVFIVMSILIVLYTVKYIITTSYKGFNTILLDFISNRVDWSTEYMSYYIDGSHYDKCIEEGRGIWVKSSFGLILFLAKHHIKGLEWK